MSIERSYWVYILASRIGGTLYIGVTNNLVRRVYEHRMGLADGFTRSFTVCVATGISAPPAAVDEGADFPSAGGTTTLEEILISGNRAIGPALTNSIFGRLV